MIFARRRYYQRSFFSLAGLVELFFINLKKILLIILSLIISGYLMIFYDYGGDYFINNGIIHRPLQALKYMFWYIKFWFKYMKSLHIQSVLKIIFFLILPYFLWRFIKFIGSFFVFFIHQKTKNSMPILSNFLYRFIKNKDDLKNKNTDKINQQMTNLFSQNSNNQGKKINLRK